MEAVFSYIISLGASVMMPILFTIIGLCIGLKFGKSLQSGLYVGVGFVGLGIVTALLTTNFNGPLKNISDIYELQLGIFDMGWPAAAAVAYNTAVGALIIPICLGVNFLMVITKTTRTVNIDLWNYWHFAFIGAVVYFVQGESLAWGYFAAIVCYMFTLVMADFTAEKFQKHYELDGISVPQPFCQSFVPFAIAINWLLDRIPGFSKLDIDAEGLKKKFGVLGEPLILGVIVGALIGALSVKEWNADAAKTILSLGVIMGAVMELIPRITKLFIDGLMPISQKTKEVVEKKFNGKKVHIGMSPALVIGHPTTLVVSLLLIPTVLFLAVVLPGNQFLPLASLAGMFYLFPLVLPITRNNVVKTFIIGLVALTVGLYFVTDMSNDFTAAANSVYAATQDAAAHVPDGFLAGALDFCSSLFGWVIFRACKSLDYIGMGLLSGFTLVMMFINRRRIKNVEDQYYYNKSGSSSAKKVPVIVLMAMIPSLLSAATEQSTVPPAVEDAIEIYQPSRSNSEDKAIAPYPETEVFEQYGQQKLPDLMGPEAVQYKRDFNYHGKRYTMYFFDLAKSVRKDKNVVSRIYFIPSDFNYIEKFDNPCNYPPVMKKLVYHDLGDLNKDFISVITTEQVCDKNGENSRYVEKEMRLPDDVANDLVHLFNGDTNLKVIPTLMNMVTETKSPKLHGKY